MDRPHRHRIAVVDLGTNSTRLLIADVEGDRLDELDRRTTVTRLGDGIDVSGLLDDDAMKRVFHALAEYRQAVDDHGGADAFIGVATSAVRDAANGERFRQRIREDFGIDVRTISGDEEARLTFLGATSATPSTEETLVIDIGGGSTEYVVGVPGADPTFHVSTCMGSVRFTERHLHGDPPTKHELDEAARAADETIAADVPPKIRDTPTEAIAVAGTPTSLAAIEQALDPYDPAKVHSYVLDRQACERILEQLATTPLEHRRRITGLHPDRAPTIVAGAAILVRSLYAFGLDRITVSETDVLQGAALAATRN